MPPTLEHVCMIVLVRFSFLLVSVSHVSQSMFSHDLFKLSIDNNLEYAMDEDTRMRNVNC